MCEQNTRKALTVAVILPAHNEAKHIGDVVRSIPESVKHIIVVDDASSDETAAVVESLDDSRVLLIRHPENRGVGGAMQTGFKAAIEGDFDVVVKMDADGQMKPDELERLIEPFRLGIADYTKGNRFYFRGATAAMPSHRSFGNTLLTFLTKIASGYWHVYDPQCGFLAARTSFLRLLDIDDLARDYFFENDMLIKMNSLNARVVDVPTSTIYGEEVSGVNVLRVMLSFPPRLIAGGVKRFWRKHLVTDFGAIGVLTFAGLALSLFGLVFGARHWLISVQTGRVVSTGTIMIAVLPIIVGVQFLVQSFSISVGSSPGAKETAQYVRQLIERNAFTE